MSESNAICSAYGKLAERWSLILALKQSAKIVTPIEPNKIAVKMPVVENCEILKAL